MAKAKRRTKGKKVRLKHPEVYAFVFFVGLIMYTVLVIALYKSKRERAAPKQSRRSYNPLTLVARTDVQALIPERGEAVIVEPDVSRTADNVVVVFVQSDYSHTERRQLIRQTWGEARNHSNGDPDPVLRVIFAVGLRQESDEYVEASIDLEISEYRDILLLNIVDVYDALTVKGLLAMTWIHESLPRVRYVVKTDDDVLLNAGAWIDAVRLLDRHNASCVVAGFVWTNPGVIREGKYAVGREAYGPDSFPAFCSGAGYILSRDAIGAVLEASAHVPLLVRDDPYFTGILAQAMGVRLLSFPKETLRFDRYFSAERLNTQPVMALHRPGTRQWYRLWNVLQARRRRGQRHQVWLRTVYPEEGGVQVSRLSEALNRTLKNECLSETVFGGTVLT